MIQMRSKPKIIAIDDVPLNLQLVCKALEADYDVQLADSGPAGLVAIRADPPDLILLDVLMPGMDGFEVCQQLKAHPLLRDIPVVFLTGTTEAGDVMAGLTLGAVDYLFKPINPSVARQRIRILLEREASRRSAQASEQHLKNLLCSLPDPLWVMDRHGVVLEQWVSVTDLLPAPPDDWVSRSVLDLLPPEAASVVLSALEEAEVRGRSQGKTFVIDHNGQHRTFELSVTVLKSGGADPQASSRAVSPRWVVVARDITTTRNQENPKSLGKRGTQAALGDECRLEDLEQFQALLKQSADAQAERGRPLAVMTIDLEGVAPADTEHGALHADRMLLEAVHRVQACMREEETVTRSGPQQLSLWIALTRDVSDALRVAERLRFKLAEPYYIGGRVLLLAPRIGIALFPEHGHAPTALLERSLQALQMARQPGQQPVQVFSAQASQKSTLDDHRLGSSTNPSSRSPA